jgi:hypothetical protein
MKKTRVRLGAAALLVAGSFLVGSFGHDPANADAQPTGSINQIFPVSSSLPNTAMCIDIPYSSWDIVQLTQWGCTGNPNQSWRLEPQNGGYRVVSNLNNYCWDIPYGSTAWGTAITQYPCHGGWNQTFYKIDHGHGTDSLTAALSNLCVDVSGYGQNWGAPLMQWGCAFSSNQQFTSSPNPTFGYIDEITGTENGVSVSGWTIAPNAPAYTLGYRVLVDGSQIGYSYSNAYRPDVGAAFPGYGDSRGIEGEFDVSLAPGLHNVCVQGDSFGVFTNIRCGSIEFVSSESSITPTTATTSGGYQDSPCRFNKISVPVSVVGLSGEAGTTQNYYPMVLAAAQFYDSQSNKISGVNAGGSSSPRLSVKSVLRPQATYTAFTSNNCGGLFGFLPTAKSKRISVNESITTSGGNYSGANYLAKMAAHEVGHAFGLGHWTGYQSCGVSIMVQGNCQTDMATASTITTPSAGDIAALEARYP